MARRLNNSGDIRRYIGNILNRVETNELDARRADTLIKGCNGLLIAIRQDVIEQQLEELEERAKGGRR